MRTSVTVLAFLILAPGACASSGTSERPSRNPDLLTTEELRTEASQGENLARVIERLRPNWLRIRSPTSFGQTETRAVVFYNGSNYGTLDTLREFRVENIESVEFIDPRDATTLYGTGYTGGIISVQGL